jgi:hypothetical protein
MGSLSHLEREIEKIESHPVDIINKCRSITYAWRYSHKHDRKSVSRIPFLFGTSWTPSILDDLANRVLAGRIPGLRG